MSENKDFKPYIPAEKVTPEITVTSVIVGVLLASSLVQQMHTWVFALV